MEILACFSQTDYMIHSIKVTHAEPAAARYTHNLTTAATTAHYSLLTAFYDERLDISNDLDMFV